MTDHHRRRAKPATDILDLKAARLQKLRILGIDLQRLVFEPRLERHNLAGLGARRVPIEHLLELAALLFIEHLVGFQNAACDHAIFKHGAGCLIRRQSGSEAMHPMLDRRKAEAITAAKGAHVKHLARRQRVHLAPVAEPIVKPAVCIAHRRCIEQRPQTDQPIANKKFLGIAVAVQKLLRFLAFPKLECRLIRVRRYRQDLGERILDLHPLAVAVFLIQGQRQGSDELRIAFDARPGRRDRHRR